MIAMIYGGSGSGKSELAETMVCAMRERVSSLVYIATMFPAGEEARERIARHRANRAHKGFTTVELYTDLASADIPDGSAVLLECLGNLVANEMFNPDGAGEGAGEAVLRGVETLLRRSFRIVVVTNDVVTDGVAYPPETEEYRRTLACLNMTLAERSAIVAETVCGIPLWHKRNEVWDI